MQAFGGWKRGWRRALGAIVLLMPLGIAQGVHAQTVYKCRDASGHVAYQDRICTGAATETRMEMPASPPPPIATVASATARARPARTAMPRVSARHAGARAPEALSYECRADNGELFYRHSGCPKSITVSAPQSSTPQKTTKRGRGKSERSETSVHVSAVPLTRSEACKRVAAGGSIGRAGHAHDESVSTYERNAGRDPCRRS